jgi:outer membrane protein TolC
VDLAIAEAEEENNAGRPSLVARLSRDLNASDTNLGVYLTMGLAGAGRTAAARKGAAFARVEAAQNALASAVTEAEIKAQELAAQLEVQTNLIAAQRDLLASVDETVDSYQRLYEAGQKSWQEVLSMYKERGEKRLALEQAEGDSDLTRLRLASMLGKIAP